MEVFMMKQKLLFTVFTVMCSLTYSDLVFDPVSNQCYTLPLSSDINDDEYIGLFFKAVFVVKNMQEVNDAWNDESVLSAEQCLQQVFAFLRRVGTPTALRLLSDLEKNVILYPDGSVFRRIY